MVNSNHFEPLHDKVAQLENDFENFELIVSTHDKLFERFFDSNKAVHSCECEDMEIFASLKKIISYDFKRLSTLQERLELVYSRMIISKEEEKYFKRFQTVSEKIVEKRRLLEKASVCFSF